MLRTGNNLWPSYRSHELARCFSCGHLLDASTAKPQGYGEGCGEHAAKCPSCGKYTHYDVDRLQGAA